MGLLIPCLLLVQPGMSPVEGARGRGGSMRVVCSWEQPTSISSRRHSSMVAAWDYLGVGNVMQQLLQGLCTCNRERAVGRLQVAGAPRSSLAEGSWQRVSCRQLAPGSRLSCQSHESVYRVLRTSRLEPRWHQ